MSQELVLKIRRCTIISCFITLSRESQMNKQGRPCVTATNREVFLSSEEVILKNKVYIFTSDMGKNSLLTYCFLILLGFLLLAQLCPTGIFATSYDLRSTQDLTIVLRCSQCLITPQSKLFISLGRTAS